MSNFTAISSIRFFLVPVRRFFSPSRSIHFGDVSDANGRVLPGPRDPNALAARNNYAQGLSNMKFTIKPALNLSKSLKSFSLITVKLDCIKWSPLLSRHFFRRPNKLFIIFNSFKGSPSVTRFAVTVVFHFFSFVTRSQVDLPRDTEVFVPFIILRFS